MLLNVSSSIFFVPAVYATISTPRDTWLALGLFASAVTSQIYHATLHPIAKMVDMTVVHVVVLYHVYLASTLDSLDWRVAYMHASIVYGVVVFWVCGMCRHSDWWHASIHVLMTAGSVCLISALRDRKARDRKAMLLLLPVPSAVVPDDRGAVLGRQGERG